MDRDPKRDRSVSGWRLALALVVAAGCAPGSGGPQPPERIVLIVIDTLRRDHVSGDRPAAPTPNIDRLAARGQVYTNLLASFHQTSMSMAALFTGRTPSIEQGGGEALYWNSRTWCGMYRFAAGADAACLPASLPTLAERLRGAGYRTIGVNSNHLLFRGAGYDRGFDDWSDVGERPPDEHFERWVRDPSKLPSWPQVHRAVEEALRRRGTDRFFLYVHYMDAHDYLRLGIPYASGVRAVDEAVGELLALLEEQDLVDGATIVLTSDHGERLGERHAIEGRVSHHGNPSFMEMLAIPLIVAPPIPGDATRLLRSEDLFDLLLGIAGPTPDRSADRRTALVEAELYLSEVEYRTLLRGRWKGSLRREDGGLLLFDLVRDPGEKRDVSEEHPQVARMLRARIGYLSEALATGAAVEPALTEDDRRKLRALGYLEEVESMHGE